MAKNAQSVAPVASAKPKKFLVVLKGTPIMGFVDAKGRQYDKRPIEPHFRRPAKDVDSEVPDAWFTRDELLELHGLKEVPAEFRKRNRVRMDLTGALFEGFVFEAGSTYEARDLFQKKFGINDADNKNWKIEETSEPIGFYKPRKARGFLQAV